MKCIYTEFIADASKTFKQKSVQIVQSHVVILSTGTLDYWKPVNIQTKHKWKKWVQIPFAHPRNT